MKLYIALALLVVLECCYCTPYRPRYDGDEGDPPLPAGSEDYEVNDKTHSIGGGFNLGGRLGLGVGLGKRGLQANIDPGVNFDWDAHAGTKTSHYRKTRPLFYPGYNPYRNQRRYQEDDDY